MTAQVATATEEQRYVTDDIQQNVMTIRDVYGPIACTPIPCNNTVPNWMPWPGIWRDASPASN